MHRIPTIRARYALVRPGREIIVLGVSHTPAGEIRLHDRRWLGHAYIDKMANARARRSFRSGTPRGLIDSAKLGGFRRVRMTDADQLHESIPGRQMRSDGFRRQGISNHSLCALLQLALRSISQKGLHPMAAPY